MAKYRKLRRQQLATSIARAEASAIVLRQVLATLPPETAFHIRLQALRDATSIGIPDIMEETDWVSDPAA